MVVGMRWACAQRNVICSLSPCGICGIKHQQNRGRWRGCVKTRGILTGIGRHGSDRAGAGDG